MSTGNEWGLAISSSAPFSIYSGGRGFEQLGSGFPLPPMLPESADNRLILCLQAGEAAAPYTELPPSSQVPRLTD